MSRKSLRQAEIKQILKLQELFHNRFLNEELINQLVSLYVKAIGSLGENLKLMKVYFLQKMQFLVSRPEIQKLLTLEKSQKSTRDKYTIKISTIELGYESEQYVKTSSLHSQPVGKKLSEMSDEDEKIKERENRIRNQLELMHQIELTRNQTPLQRRHKQSNYVVCNKLNEMDFEEPQVSLIKGSDKKRSLRKNSDSIESKNRVQERFDGKNITKEYFLEIQRQTNSKVDHMNLNFDIQYHSSNVENSINQKILNVRSIQMRHNEEKQQGLQKIGFKQRNNIQNQEFFWQIQQYGFGTFAGGFQTPQFGQSGQSPTWNAAIQFPTPMGKITEININKYKQDKQQDEKMEGIMVLEEESERDYADDQYF